MDEQIESLILYPGTDLNNSVLLQGTRRWARRPLAYLREYAGLLGSTIADNLDAAQEFFDENTFAQFIPSDPASAMIMPGSTERLFLYDAPKLGEQIVVGKGRPLSITGKKIFEALEKYAQSAKKYASETASEAVRTATDNAAKYKEAVKALMKKAEKYAKAHATRTSNAGRKVKPLEIGIDKLNWKFQYHPGKTLETNFRNFEKEVRATYPDVTPSELESAFNKLYGSLFKKFGGIINYLDYIR